ncbi:MAG: hypothetical protein JKY22_09650 [Flavobacteriaceae bacterium]|nr:hypothetical protein [Flavobacteriaceae bacterium]
MRHFFLFILATFVLTGCNSDDNNTQISEELTLATIFIDPISNIKGDIANTGGDIVDDGGSLIILKGICWSTSPNPTLDDNTDNSGPGMSEFIGQITNIDFNSTYYVRVYATNTTGVAYSEELSFISTNECTLNVFEGDVSLHTQAEVNAFGANEYYRITGYLDINEPISGGSDFITDLTPLNNLRSVARFDVNLTHELEDFSGLENLTVIKENFEVFGNKSLLTLEGLSNVSSTIEGIGISNNDVLQNINGLSGITTLVKPAESHTRLIVLGNPMLNNIDGLSNITSVDESIVLLIGSSEVMTHLDGLSNISGTVQILGITGIDNLTNLNGISNITRINANFSLNNNYNLTDLTGLNHLEFIGGDLQIRNNWDLTNLDALSVLTTIGGNLAIINNELIDFCGLQPLLSNDGLGGNYLVTGNNFNPSQQDIIDGNCSL